MPRRRPSDDRRRYTVSRARPPRLSTCWSSGARLAFPGCGRWPPPSSGRTGGAASTPGSCWTSPKYCGAPGLSRKYGTGEAAAKTVLDGYFYNLTANRFLEDKITGSILSEDEIADSASPELADIRRHIRAAAGKVRDVLNRLISSNQSKYLQEAIITMRGGRYVVPVKSEHKNDIPGLVHDVSGSGGTFFIEPMGVVNANNELRELQAREEKEIERILAELSADCAGFQDDIAPGLPAAGGPGRHLRPGQAVLPNGGHGARPGGLYRAAKGPAPPYWTQAPPCATTCIWGKTSTLW